MDSKKRNSDASFSKRECKYGERCFRKNPIHFKEFSHRHLDEIFGNGLNLKTNDYNIPDKYYLTKDIIVDQLKALESLNGSNSNDKSKSPPKKIQKVEKQEEPETIELDDDDDVAGPSQKSTPSPPKPISDDKKSKMTTDLKDFFKVRAAEQKVKLEKEKEKEKEQEKEKPKSNLEKKKESSTSSSSSIDLSQYFPVTTKRGAMARKLKHAAPYNFFLTTVTANTTTHDEPLSVTFQDLLDDSLGELESSVQINFMVDIGWLYANYCNTGNGHLPLLILYGDESPELRTISNVKPNISTVKVQINTPYGCHHSKMMLFGYKDNSMRIVISTANLYEDDWHNRVQGLWVSDRLPMMKDTMNTAEGDSETNFREDFLKYLVAYNISKLQPWIARIRKTDFSSIKVFFVASIPGSHRPDPRKGHPFGHARLGNLLAQNSAKISENCPVVAQCSSIGNLGPNAQSYLLSEIAISMRKDSAPAGLRKVPQLKLIYPSYSNVKNSYDGMMGGGCLPYGKAAHVKQLWLQSHLCQWKANSRNRTRSMPHIKSYARYSDDGELYWFCLTSANLSKSAWGSINKSSKLESILRINSYEAGVLFIPKIMVGKNHFPLETSKQVDDVPLFPLPYDSTLAPYSNEDTPFVMDYLHEFLATRNK